MALSTGTALKHGTYVLDALWGDDSIGPLYMATHVPTGQLVQVRIVGSRHPERIPSPEIRTEFYGLLQAISKLKHPGLANHLFGFEEEGVCYQIFSARLGYPLTKLITPQSVASSHFSMRLIHHLVSVLETLRPLDWSALSLSPDQLWQGPGQSAEQVVLTGFDFTHFAPTGSLSQTQPDVAEVQETMMVKGLSQLLYFLLTGQQAAQTSGPLAIDLKHRLPGLHPAFGKAIQQGIPAAEQTSGLKLAEWMNLLPSLHDLPAEVSSTQSTQLFPSNGNLRSQPEQSVIPPKYRPGTAPVVSTQVAQVPIDRTRHAAAVTAVTGFSQRSLALLGTSLVASLVGLGLGLHNRMQPNQLLSPGTLNPEQSFPPLSDWPGDEPGSSQEFLPRPNRPDYGESPSRPQPSSPVEADLVAPTEPTVAEPVAPGSESDTMAPFSTEWEGQNSESGIEGGENGQPAPEQPVDLAPEFPVESGPAPDRAPSPAPPPLEVKPAPQPIPAPAPPIPEAAPPPPLAPTAPPAAPAPTTTSSSGFSNQESPDTDKVAPFIGG